MTTLTETVPTLLWERELAAQGYALVAGCDEVGRGSLAGPVSVGVVVIEAATATELPGVKDSKLLAHAVRESPVPQIRQWAAASAVGHASATEIDALGLMAALRLAGTRALAAITAELLPGLVILDGNYDWLSAPAQPELVFGPDAEPSGSDPLPGSSSTHASLPTPAPMPAQARMPVQTRIKADLQCLSVAAASVLAKVERDALMTELAAAHPVYGWDGNKGYATAAHRAALREHGPSTFHRRSWNLI